MKMIKLLTVSAFALALCATPALAKDKHAPCCVEAKKAKKECSHECCVAVQKDNKDAVCEKCGGKKEEKKKS